MTIENIFICVLLAQALDAWLGEPSNRWHPLVYFGQFASCVEGLLNCTHSSVSGRMRGSLAWLLVVGLTLLGCWGMLMLAEAVANWFAQVLSVILLYLSIGQKSLLMHARAIAQPLMRQDLPRARQALGLIVSRDTQNLNEQQISTAAVESVLENGSDAIFSALFWFVLLGPLGAVAFRLINTLDAMWGYRNRRYQYFGWAAARIDDAAGFIPARLTMFAYILLGDRRRAWQAYWRHQVFWYSPNAGPVMEVGASTLGLRLGGSAHYEGQVKPRPTFGTGRLPQAEDIDRATDLILRSSLLFSLILFMIAVINVGIALNI